MEQRTPFVDNISEPAEADIEIADTPCPMGGNLSAETIELNGHALGGAIEDSDLCSETTGCMRMEAGGGAQICQVEQVAALSDQKADFMLGQQLQRWGKDVLYEESLTMVAQMMKPLQECA